jgi:hypothetical protein
MQKQLNAKGWSFYKGKARLFCNMDLFLFIYSAEHKEDAAYHGYQNSYDRNDEMDAAGVFRGLSYISVHLPRPDRDGYYPYSNRKHIFHKLPSGNQKSLGAFIDHYRVGR